MGVVALPEPSPNHAAGSKVADMRAPMALGIKRLHLLLATSALGKQGLYRTQIPEPP